jgi:CRP/FNR family transcriptional regulator, cyclic AMP receptor protein
MRTEQIVRLLGETQLFGSLDEGVRASIAERMLTRRFSKGDFVFHEGDPGESLYVVAEGVISVFVTSEDGEEMVLAHLHSCDMFGELAVIDGGPRSASAKAVEPTTLVALTQPAFVHALQQTPQLIEALHRSLGRLLRRVLVQASDLVFLDLPGRVAKLLVGLAEERGIRTDDDIVVDLQLSQETLARMVGGSRPTVNQILKDFEHRGYVALEGRKLKIKEESALKRRAAQ